MPGPTVDCKYKTMDGHIKSGIVVPAASFFEKPTAETTAARGEFHLHESVAVLHCINPELAMGVKTRAPQSAIRLHHQVVVPAGYQGFDI